ncbi:outer membrane protein assembly factor BamA [Holosporaceae bacterium 'Namur']|nr:outer membrane protein assembly factor BamA [Holosporaceae bacterium 'Namur']
MKRFLQLANFFAFALFPSLTLAESIKQIKVTGNQRISPETVEAYLENRVGDQYNQKKVDSSIKSLFSTGFFSNIKIYQQQSTLVVEVEENPLINKVAFEGNKRLKDKDLLKELSMVERSSFSNAKLQQDVKKILSLYQKRGRYTASVEPKLIKLDQNRANIIYEINEGSVAKIKKINFVGNHVFTDQKLSSAILSKESRWYQFFSSSDVYDGDKLNIDQEFLKRFYLSEGFADFEVRSATAELTPNKDSFILSFVVHEGPAYNVRNIKIESKIPNIDIDKLYSLLEFKSGDLYSINQVENSIEKITDHLGDMGYAFVDVEDSIEKDPENKALDITFIINETYKIYVNRINIKNNTRTLDHVIRREFKLAEGDPYNTTKVFRSKQRIKNLGFFNSVEFKNSKTDEPDKVDIDVEVQETSTGSLNFAAGYNTSSGPLGSIALTESNFLGKGQEVGIELTRAKKAADVSFSFTEPQFLDYPLSVGFDIFSNSKNRAHESSYDSKSVGFVLRAGYELTEHLYHGVRYSAKRERISNIPSDASIYIKEQEGKNTVSSIGHSLTYDKLDDRIDPTKGYLLKFNQDLAGLGGQTYYIDHKLVGAAYYPVYKRDVILSFVAKAGNITGLKGKPVRINDRTFLGSDDIRGFDSAGIGPRTKEKKEALGGKTFYTGSLELTFPVGLSSELGVRGVAFTDFGALFDPGQKQKDKEGFYNDHSLRASAGVGIKWNSALGNIRIDYGIPFKKKSYDEKKSFRISFGTRF